MMKGDLLRVLYDAESKLPELLKDAELWSTLDVDYEPPRVERLWLQFDEDHRLYLHRIHPCEKALFHSHPWPSSVHVLSGRYEMEIGEGGVPIATVTLTAGAEYEMVKVHAWHSVKPIGVASLSVMVTGKPWNKTNFNPSPPTKLGPLPAEAKAELLGHFRQFFGSR